MVLASGGMMIDQSIYNLVLGVASALGGWWMKAMWEALKELKNADDKLAKEVSDLKVLVAGDYVRRELFDRLSDAIFAKLDRIESKLDGKADKS
jgi:hypothetical protein